MHAKEVVPPENIFIGKRFEHLIRELSKRGASIEIKQMSIEEKKSWITGFCDIKAKINMAVVRRLTKFMWVYSVCS